MISPRVTSKSVNSAQCGAPEFLAKASEDASPTGLSAADTRQAWIRMAAYFRAAQRGFAPGREVEDWLEAEREIDRKYPIQREPRPVMRLRGRSAAR